MRLVFVYKTGFERQYIHHLVLCRSNQQSERDGNVKQFLGKFEGTEETLKWYFGVHVVINHDVMTLLKTAFIDQIIETFGFGDCRTFYIPIESNFFDELTLHQHDKPATNNSYRYMIGCLQFLSHRTRPCIATETGILSQFCNSPTDYHITCVRLVF